MYSIPFIAIDFFKSLYGYVDMVTVVKGLVNMAKYTAKDAEVIYSILSTWAAKFNMVIISVSTGIIVSLIPNLTESIVKKDKNKINNNIVQTLNILLFFMIPMTLGISFLSKEIWIVFYGASEYGPSILGYYIFVGLFIGLFTAIVITLQTLKDYKAVFTSLIVGVLIKIILNRSLMLAFYKMNLSSYFGAITASLIGYIIPFIYCLIVLHSKFNINFEKVIKNLIDIMCGSILMILVLMILRLIIGSSDSRFVCILYVLIYSIIGVLIYFVYTYKTKIIQSTFGKNIFSFKKK